MDLPRQLGPYRLVARLGHGGMAEVFLAEAYGASGFEKKVVIKTLRPELRGEPDYERSLIEEAKLGARLSHRNLVAVHDLGIDQGAYYVRMDYVEGADVETLRRQAPPSPALALAVVEEVALALEYIHGFADDAGRPIGLVHRDVSPSNILVSRAGEVKLADLGIAKATMLAHPTQNRLKGTIAYMSPEQVRGDPLAPASDQFSLGITLTQLLTGQRPFDGASMLETMERIEKAATPDLDGLPETARPVVERCLARDPGARFATTTALREAIRALRVAEPPAGPPELAAWVRGR